MNSEDLRTTMRLWASGVAVLTARHGETAHGMTVNSFTSVALQPPLVSVSLQKNTRTLNLVLKSGFFGITILGADQQEISERFAGRVPEEGDRLAGLETGTLLSGAPLLVGGLAWLDCRLSQALDIRANMLLLGEVLATRLLQPEGAPLVYFRHGYWELGQRKKIS
ncbi:MAG: flavin reductase family protein [Anaerolineales bacterium]